jgi:hypothetical protein
MLGVSEGMGVEDDGVDLTIRGHGGDDACEGMSVLMSMGWLGDQ